MNEAVWSMSWRRFAVLVKGLSSKSWWHQLRSVDGSKPRVIDTAKDPQAAKSFFDSLKTRKQAVN